MTMVGEVVLYDWQLVEVQTGGSGGECGSPFRFVLGDKGFPHGWKIQI